VNVEAQRWSCFAGCGYGDIYELVKLAEGIDHFPECKELAERRFGATERAPSGRHSGKRKRKAKHSWL
jgi:hypothetical protein